MSPRSCRIYRNSPRYIALLSSLWSAAFAEAQMSEEWLARFGPDAPGTWTEARGIAVDADGNAFVTGNAQRKTGAAYDLILLKYSATGELSYVNRLGGSGTTIGLKVVLDRDNNVVIGGISGALSSYPFDWDIVIAKYSADGAPIWSVRYDGPLHANDTLGAIGVDEKGNIYATGRTAGLPWSEYVTLKYSGTGELLWEDRYHHPLSGGDDVASALALDSNGNLYVSGTSGGRFGTIKYAPDGTRVWIAESRGPGWLDVATRLAVDSNDNVYVGGVSRGTPFDPVDQALIIKYDAQGNALWNQTYRLFGHADDSVNALAVDRNGDLLVAGTSWPGTWPDCAWLVLKYSSDGNLLWSDQYQPRSRSHAYGVAVDTRGNAYVTGDADGMTTIKYSLDGERQWRATIGSFLTGVGVEVAVQGSSVYATGAASGHVTAQAVTAKYPQDSK